MGIVTKVAGRLRAIGLRRIVLLALGLTVVWWATSRLLPVQVTTVEVGRRLLVQSIVATGRVRSSSRARLGPAVSGTVATVLVREGDRVRPGEVLVRLDAAEARALLAQAEATAAQAEASLAGVSDLREAVASATLRSAETALSRFEADYRRIRRLVEAGATAADQLDAARQAFEEARGQRDIAAAQLKAAKSGGVDRRSAEATLAQARAAVATARARLANLTIEAPGSGRVLTRDVEPGDVVQPGRVLMTLALDGPTQLVAVPDEKDVARLKEGQPATASADAYPTESFPARVSFLAPSIDPAQGTVEVRLDVDSAPPYLRPDMTVSIQIETARRPNALVIPATTVNGLRGTTSSVFVVRDGRVQVQAVRIGVQGDREVEVLDGLVEADLVVTNADNVAPGQRVRVRRLEPRT